MPWPTLWSLLPALLRRRLAAARAPDEVRRARALVAAVDAGGLPLNPALVNQVARSLGLEVSRQAPVDQTVERIRAALRRLEDG
jgi:hypothetical protein